MSPKEAARRMQPMRRRVIEFDVHHWANTFLGALDMVTESRGHLNVPTVSYPGARVPPGPGFPSLARALAQQLRSLTTDPRRRPCFAILMGRWRPSSSGQTTPGYPRRVSSTR